jgi:hypothetical protein
MALKTALAAVAVWLAVGSVCHGDFGLRDGERTSGGDAVVYDSDPRSRRDLRRAVGEVVETWEETTGFRRGALPPVIVRRIEPTGAGDLEATLFFLGEGGVPKVQVDFAGGGAPVREVFRALALRVMHDEDPPEAGEEVPQPPAWFLDALVAIHEGTAANPSPGVHAAFLGGDSPPDLEDTFRRRPGGSDSLEATLQAVRSAALVRVLLASKEGRKGLRSLILSEDFSGAGGREVVAFFPSIAGDGVLARLWTLELARGSMPSRFSSLGVAASAEELDRLIGDAAPEGGDSELPRIAGGPGGREAMLELASGLLRLHFRAHPVMKPLIEEYRMIAMRLAEKPRARVSKRLEACAELRRALVARQTAIEDHLNWFEATRLDAHDGSILDGFTTIEVPPRNDPFTRHLDALERRGW